MCAMNLVVDMVEEELAHEDSETVAKAWKLPKMTVPNVKKRKHSKSETGPLLKAGFGGKKLPHFDRLRLY